MSYEKDEFGASSFFLADILVLKSNSLNLKNHQLALVALEILGMLVTSVNSERAFSTGRYVICDNRTKISSNHACDQMLIKCNREIAMKVVERIDILEADH